MACTLILTEQLESDVLTETEAAATSGAGLIGNTQTGWTEISGATVQAALDDIDDVFAARTEAFAAAGDLLTATGASAPTILSKGSPLQVLRVNAGGTALEWAAVSASPNDLLDGSAHQDTAARTPVRGDIIVATAAPLWDSLAVGGANTLFASNGTDPSWKSDFMFDGAFGLEEQSLTIATGAIGISKSRIKVAPESGSADDLDTITRSGNITDGDFILITASTGNTITVTENGNIKCGGKTLDITDQDYIELVYDLTTTSWYVVSEVMRFLWNQTDVPIEGMPMHQDSSGEGEWIANPRVFQWKKHFAFAASNAGWTANGCIYQSVGTAGSFAVSTYTTNDGVHMLSSATNPGDGSGVTMADDSQGTIHDSTVEFVLEAWLYHDSSGAVAGGNAYEVWFGLTDTLFGFGADEAIFYSVSPGNTWDCRTTAATTTTTTNLGTSSIGAWQRLKIMRDNTANNVKFYINGSLVATHTTNLPTGTQMYFFWGYTTLDPVRVDCEIDYSGILHAPANV